MSKLIIGISGKMGSGKSTISKILKEALSAKVEVISFAAPLYKAQELIYKEYGIQLQGEKDRELLISLGKWGRDKSADFWVDQFCKRLIESESEIIICDDVRFPNEAKLFEKHGFLFRIDGEQRGDNVDETKAQSPSECALDDYDFEHRVSNTLSPEDMCKQIAIMMGGENEETV